MPTQTNNSSSATYSGVSQIPGTARKDNGETKEISIQSIDHGEIIQSIIKRNTPTWLVIHGNQSNSENMKSLANAVKSYAPDDHQVLTLDWRSATNNGAEFFNPESWFAGLGESTPWIQPVAETATSMLSELGISGDNLNLVGHSLGSYVSWEIARMNYGGVNNIIALDPAADVPGWYITRNIDFSEVSDNSWAFVGSALGSPERAMTADQSFEIIYDDVFCEPDPFTKHSLVKDFVEDYLRNDSYRLSPFYRSAGFDGQMIIRDNSDPVFTYPYIPSTYFPVMYVDQVRPVSGFGTTRLSLAHCYYQHW
ncbi:MAG: alpha/beta fold hydrolase [Microcoleaceae cyanobacterium MO_207.B10]|nr:alpha/beta fold hydrolase [Microcoleaceae cyanobacterium MO_207.B10]